LFHEAGWSLQREVKERGNHNHLLPQTCDGPGRTSIILILPPPHRRSRPGSIGSVNSKHLRFHIVPSVALSLPDNSQPKTRGPHSIVSNSVADVSWKCRDRMHAREPLKDRKSFGTHYNSHFLLTVCVCFIQKVVGGPCHELWQETDNLQSHLKSHH
jgi:hypothetical protein